MNCNLHIKTHLSKLLIFIGGFSIIVFSACNFEPKTEKTIHFQNITSSSKIHLFDNENFPALNLDLKILQSSDSIAHQKLNQAIALAFFDTIYRPDYSVNQLLNLWTQLASDNYKTMESFYAADSAEMGASFNWQVIKNNNIDFISENLICFSVETYIFSGGAHGNTMKQHYIFDLNQEKLLYGKDIFDLNQCDAIKELQKESLKKTVENVEYYSLEGLKCETNFYVNDSGFIFHYDHYEIASYAAGPIDIFISFDDSRNLLRSPEFLEQLKK